MATLKTLPLLALWLAAASRLGAADAALINLLPPDAQVIFGVQVDQSRYSPFGRYLLARLEKADGDLKEFIALTGFDPRRDISEIVGAGGGDGKQGLVCVRGRFAVPKILAALPRDAAAPGQYRGVTLVSGQGPKPAGVAFLNGSLAVAGEGELLRAAIDRWLDGGAFPAQLAAQAAEASSRYDAWMVAAAWPAELAGRLPPESGGAAAQGDLIRSIEQMSGGVKLGSDVTIGGESVLKTDKDAAALADVVRFLASFIQMQAKSERAMQLAEYARRMQIAAEGNRVRVSLVLPEAELEKLFERLDGRPVRQPKSN
jgi:hypothetical protein